MHSISGWGGCTVSLVRSEAVDTFLAAVAEKYYAPLIEAGRLKQEDLAVTLFASRPSCGAAILKLKFDVEI